MDLTVHIPDDIASRMNDFGVDLSRRVLEGLALEELKAGHITEPELGRMLGWPVWKSTASSSPTACMRTTPWKTSRRNVPR